MSGSEATAWWLVPPSERTARPDQPMTGPDWDVVDGEATDLATGTG